jgi:hypothetical protein
MSADPYTDETSATQRFTRSASATERLRAADFPIVVRGYHRQTVDLFLAELLELVEALEANQTREGVVQKALGELGEETAGILQRAHETADDITARSRAQADARLQRAEREAEILRRDADEYAEQVVVDTRALWEDRQRLIEDIRQLADDVLGTADDAIERLTLPEQIGTETVEEPETAALPPESEVPGEPEPTEPFRLGAVSEEPQAELDPPEDERGHTVELEALPGGSDDPTQRERD